MRDSKYLQKIQNLPSAKRKLVFWLMLIVLGLVLFTFWIINIRQRIKNFPKEKFLEDIKLPKFKEKLGDLPKPEIPISIIEESLKKIEEQKKEAEPSINPQD